MPALKRKPIQELANISDGDVNEAPPAKKIRNTSPIDLTSDRDHDAADDDDTDGDGDDEVAQARATKAEPVLTPRTGNLEQQVAVQTSTPAPAARQVESTGVKAIISEAADRYVPRINVQENTEYRSPFKFCSKPPLWRKWSGADYLDFVEELRSQFNPHPFSRLTGKPVEEILHVWSALVANPLYDTIEAKRRGEEGMQQHFDTLNKFGTPNRPWAGGKIRGELDNVKAGSILLITQDEGNKEELKFSELSKADINYLKASLTASDWKMLAGTA